MAAPDDDNDDSDNDEVVTANSEGSSDARRATLPHEDDVDVELCVATPPLRETWRRWRGSTRAALPSSAVTWSTLCTQQGANNSSNNDYVDDKSNNADGACVCVYAGGECMSGNMAAAVCCLVTRTLRWRLRALLLSLLSQRQHIDDAVASHAVLRQCCCRRRDGGDGDGDTIEVVWSASLLHLLLVCDSNGDNNSSSISCCCCCCDDGGVSDVALSSLVVRAVPLHLTCLALHTWLTQHNKGSSADDDKVCCTTASTPLPRLLRLTLQLHSCRAIRYSRHDAAVMLRLLSRLHRRHARRAAQCRESGTDAVQLALPLLATNNSNNSSSSSSSSKSSNRAKTVAHDVAQATALLVEAVNDYDASARVAQAGILYVHRHTTLSSSQQHDSGVSDDACAAVLRARQRVYVTLLDEEERKNNSNSNNDCRAAGPPAQWWRRVLSPMYVPGANVYNDVLLCLPPLTAPYAYSSNNNNTNRTWQQQQQQACMYGDIWCSVELREARAALWWRSSEAAGNTHTTNSNSSSRPDHDDDNSNDKDNRQQSTAEEGRQRGLVPVATALHALRYTLQRQLVAAVANAAHATLLLLQHTPPPQQQQEHEGEGSAARLHTLFSSRALHTRAAACERAAALSLELVTLHCPQPPPPPVLQKRRRFAQQQHEEEEGQQHARTRLSQQTAAQEELCWCYTMYAKLCVRAMRLYAMADAAESSNNSNIAASTSAMRTARALHDSMRRWRNARERCALQQQQRQRQQQQDDDDEDASWCGDAEASRLVTLLSAAQWSSLVRDVTHALPPSLQV